MEWARDVMGPEYLRARLLTLPGARRGTQSALADELGVKRQAVSSWLTGSVSPNSETQGIPSRIQWIKTAFDAGVPIALVALPKFSEWRELYKANFVG